MEDDRILLLNDDPPDSDGRYVLYWMQQSQRASFNHALEHAARIANEREQSLVVGFGLTDEYPEANERHYAFMLEGLAELRGALHERGIKFVACKGEPDHVALKLAVDASVVICDRGYLRHQRRWRKRVAANAGKRVVQVESGVVVPVETTSDRAEFAARTLRPKLHKVWADYLGDLRQTDVHTSSLPLHVSGDLDVGRPGEVLRQLDVDRSVGKVTRFRGGTSQARKQLRRFRKRPRNCTFPPVAFAAMIGALQWQLEAEHGGTGQRAGFLASTRRGLA